MYKEGIGLEKTQDRIKSFSSDSANIYSVLSCVRHYDMLSFISLEGYNAR